MIKFDLNYKTQISNYKQSPKHKTQNTNYKIFVICTLCFVCDLSRVLGIVLCDLFRFCIVILIFDIWILN